LLSRIGFEQADERGALFCFWDIDMGNSFAKLSMHPAQACQWSNDSLQSCLWLEFPLFEVVLVDNL
jgi:hypothetical protein